MKQWLSKGYNGSIRKPTELSHLSSAELIGFNGLIKPLHWGLEQRLRINMALREPIYSLNLFSGVFCMNPLVHPQRLNLRLASVEP